MEPVVSDKITLSANNAFQLKTTGLTKTKAHAILKTKAQNRVKYFVYRVICCLPNSPSSFCSLSKAGTTGVNSCITIDALIYGKIPSDPMPKKELPVKFFAKPNNGFSVRF